MARTTQNSGHRAIEKFIGGVELQGGLLTNYPVVINNTMTTNGNATISGTLTAGVQTSAQITHPSKAAINSTATATAAQVATGYITSTSGAATTITLPTGTLLGTQLGATQGTVLDLYVDNTAGANTVTMAVATNGIKSDAAATTAASFGQLTVASGVTGIGRFTLMFSSATAYVFTRTA